MRRPADSPDMSQMKRLIGEAGPTAIKARRRKRMGMQIQRHRTRHGDRTGEDVEAKAPADGADVLGKRTDGQGTDGGLRRERAGKGRRGRKR